MLTHLPCASARVDKFEAVSNEDKFRRTMLELTIAHLVLREAPRLRLWDQCTREASLDSVGLLRNDALRRYDFVAHNTFVGQHADGGGAVCVLGANDEESVRGQLDANGRVAAARGLGFTV